MEHSIKKLTRLYLGFLFQKITIFIFILFLLSIFFILLYMSKLDLKNEDYVFISKYIHKNYFDQAIFILELFNSIIIATIVISLVINANSFDSLFISYTSRFKICISKFLAILLVLFLLMIYEFIILIVIPLFRYSYFKIELSHIIIFLDLISYSLIEIIITMLVTTLFPYVITPMFFVFISIVFKLICSNNSNFNDYASKLLPLAKVDFSGISSLGLYLAPLWIILLFLVYISVYNVKDL